MVYGIKASYGTCGYSKLVASAAFNLQAWCTRVNVQSDSMPSNILNVRNLTCTGCLLQATTAQYISPAGEAGAGEEEEPEKSSHSTLGLDSV